jgi:hypothetical protein
MSSSIGSSGRRSDTHSPGTETISEFTIWTQEANRAHFQSQLRDLAIAAGIPLSLPRSLLVHPSQRAATQYASNKAGAEQFLMSLRPKKLLGGKSTKGFEKDEVLLALDKAIADMMSVHIVEALLQLAAAAGATAGASSNSFTTNKKGHAIPTLDYLFTQADHAQSADTWRRFLGRVSQRALDASLASILKSGSNDVGRVKALLEHGANPELCYEQILDLISTGSEDIVEAVLLSPLIKNTEFLSQGLPKAVSHGSLRNTSMLLFRGADPNLNQGDALKTAVSNQHYDLALAIISLANRPISPITLDETVALIGSWDQRLQRPYMKMFLYAGAYGPRTSKAVSPFITSQETDIVPILIESAAFRHSSFPVARLFEYAIQARNTELALEVLRMSNNRSVTEYIKTGVHLQLVRQYPMYPEETAQLISEFLTLGISGDHTSQMLLECCAADQIENSEIMSLMQLLIQTGNAKASYADGKSLLWAIDAGNTAVVRILLDTKPTKNALNAAASHLSSALPDNNPAKLDIWSALIDAGASGTTVDQELIAAVDNTAYASKKVDVLLRTASVDHSGGKAVISAIKLNRLDLLEKMLLRRTPSSLALAAIWKQVRKLFALTEDGNGRLQYETSYMQRTFELLYESAKNAAPLDELLYDATQCPIKRTATELSRMLIRWGASPDHSLGLPLQACIKRADIDTLSILLSTKVSKTSLKYAFDEALQLSEESRFSALDMIIRAGVEKASLDAALLQVLREDKYDSATVLLLVGAGARSHGSGESLVPPAIHLDTHVVEMLLPSVTEKDSILKPLKAVLHAHSDWQVPDGKSLSMVKLLLQNCNNGPWADVAFVSQVRSLNQHGATLFARHLTSNTTHSDALYELLDSEPITLSRGKLGITQYLLSIGARGDVIDKAFLQAAQTYDHEWIRVLQPYLSNPSVALSAFDKVANDKNNSAPLRGNRLEIIKFLLEQGVSGPVVDEIFIKSASALDVQAMNDLLPFISSTAVFSESLMSLCVSPKALVSAEGLAAAKLLLDKGASGPCIDVAARTATASLSIDGVKLILKKSSSPSASRAVFQGLMDESVPLKSSESQTILQYLLANGLDHENARMVARMAASTFDLALMKFLAGEAESKELCELAFNTAISKGINWRSPENQEFIYYLLDQGVSDENLDHAIVTASKALFLPAIKRILQLCNNREATAEKAFASAVSNNNNWSSVEGLEVIKFLIQNGAKGAVVERTAAEAAATSNYDALDVFLNSSIASTVVPAAFKAVTKRTSKQLSSEQLAMASLLLKRDLSTETISNAACETAKQLDLEALRVLAQSERFQYITDDVLRVMVKSEELWHTPDGMRLIDFLLNKGVAEKTVEIAVSKVAAALDIDALRTIIGNTSSPSIIESAFTSLLVLEKKWLNPEGVRIAEYLLQHRPSQASADKAFIQACQYLHYDAAQLFHPYIQDVYVFNEAMRRATETDTDWLSELHLIRLLLESGAEGEAVESAYIKSAKALDYPSLELLASRIDRTEMHSKAFTTATNTTKEWRHSLDVVSLLLENGARGESVEAAFVEASKALDYDAAILLTSGLSKQDTYSRAFDAAMSNEKWLLPDNFQLLHLLHENGLDINTTHSALVSASSNLNVDVVNLLAQKADRDMCTAAFTAAMQDAVNWNSSERAEIIQTLTQNGARGESVEQAFISSVQALRADLVKVLANNIDSQDCVCTAFDKMISTNDKWLTNPDALEILRLLTEMGATGESVHMALVVAAGNGNNDAVQILAPAIDEPSAFTVAITSLIQSQLPWFQDDYLELIATLLAGGAAGESVDEALVMSIKHIILGEASEELMDMLLKRDADVNYLQGQSLQMAAANGRIDLLTKLLQWSPDSHSLYMSLKASMCNEHEEDTVLALFNTVTNADAVIDVNHISEAGQPLIFYSLLNYPTSSRLASIICQLAADLSTKISWQVYEDEPGFSSFDQVPPLHFAILAGASDEVIVDVLLEYGGKLFLLTGRGHPGDKMKARRWKC